MWIQCWPVAKLWTYDMQGSCWPYYVVQNYMTFAAGTWLWPTVLLGQGADIDDSLFWHARHCAHDPSVEDRLDSCHQQKGEDRRTSRYEHGRVVCLTIPPCKYLSVLSDQFLYPSSAVISFLKIISLADISDSSCEPSFLLISNSYADCPEIESDNVKATTVDVKVFGTAEPAVTIIAVSIPILRAFICKDAAQKSQSIQFIQFSHISEPSAGRSVPSLENLRHSDEGLVKNASQPSAAHQSGPPKKG